MKKQFQTTKEKEMNKYVETICKPLGDKLTQMTINKVTVAVILGCFIWL